MLLQLRAFLNSCLWVIHIRTPIGISPLLILSLLKVMVPGKAGGCFVNCLVHRVAAKIPDLFYRVDS